MTSKRTDPHAPEGSEREPIDDGFASNLEFLLDVTADLRRAVDKDSELRAALRSYMDESALDRGSFELR